MKAIIRTGSSATWYRDLKTSKLIRVSDYSTSSSFVQSNESINWSLLNFVVMKSEIDNTGIWEAYTIKLYVNGVNFRSASIHSGSFLG